jgi:hypothetical protein
MDLVLKGETQTLQSSFAAAPGIAARLTLVFSVAYGDHPKGHLIQKRESILLREQVSSLFTPLTRALLSLVAALCLASAPLNIQRRNLETGTI